ncbi:MAG TPA: hypothetical protein PLO51_00295 [Candidatus Micrarchaeota archaeon]|nr:hypothetical protein [Candidatus Micrarchaeota archaeon]
MALPRGIPSPAGRRPKGQVTVEFVMIVSFLFMVLLSALVISSIFYGWVAVSRHTDEAEQSAKVLAAAVSHISDSGEGSSLVVFVPGPSDGIASIEDHMIVITTNYTMYTFATPTSKMAFTNSSNFTLNSNARVYMLNGTVRIENA